MNADYAECSLVYEKVTFQSLMAQCMTVALAAQLKCPPGTTMQRVMEASAGGEDVELPAETTMSELLTLATS